MKKLRLTTQEEQSLIQSMINKFKRDCNRNISTFSYTKEDVDKFLKELSKEKIKKPIIRITAEAYVKMYELVRQSSVEIQWHGLVNKVSDIHYIIYDILLFPQINSATSTNSNQNEFAEWQTKLIMDQEFPIEKMRMHGHSHVNMNVYSSSIDDGYQSELITKVDDGDYYIFLVLNKKMEMYALLYDFKQQVLFEGKDIEIQIQDHSGENIKEWCKNQIEEYCTNPPERKWRPTYPSGFQLETYGNNQYISEILEPPKRKGGKHGFK